MKTVKDDSEVKYFAAGVQLDKIDSIVNLINKHQYSSGDRILKEVKELLK